ncbi:hypothetical protein V5799_030170 [Amblyomma americanum]|uniref:Uncharacterized protein n=1 Tax=Amblyomma americanum TaxID=6943 RepID=A0AAQ4EP33_AMBAM
MNFFGVPDQKSPAEIFSSVFDLDVKRNVPYAFRFKVPRPAPSFFRPQSNSSRERRRFRMYRHHLTLARMTKCEYCFASSLALYNERCSLNVSLEEVLAFDRGIPGLVPLTPGTDAARYTKVATLKELYRRLPFLNETSLRNAFNGTVLEVDEATDVSHSGEEAIFDVVSYLLTPERQPLSLAHLIVYTVSTTFAVLYVKVLPTQLREKTVRSWCFQRASSHDELWNMVYASWLTSAAKDRFVREAFSEAREAVRAQVRSGTIVDHRDQAKADRLLYGVTLVLPRERYLVDFEPPKASKFLVQNYLSVSEFEYRVLMEQARRNIRESYPAVWTTGKHMAIETDFYRFLHISYKPSAIPSLSVSVFRLATALWALLLNNPSWSEPTARNIRAFTDCYGKAYWSMNGAGTTLWYGEPETALTSTSAALALRGVRAAIRDVDDWLVVKPASKGTRMSHAQLFYGMFASMFCNWDTNSSVDAVSTNAPLSHLRDFAETFACSRDSLMVAKECCQCS